MPLSQEQKIFSTIFIAFWEYVQNSAHFAVKGQLYSLNISE